MACNWERREVPNGGKVTICERGQCIRSLDQWAEIFGKNWDKYKVRRFFKLLKSGNMIRLDKAIKAQRLTVVNYDSYQGQRNDNATETVGETQRKRNGDATEAPQENNYNNYNKDEEAQQRRSIDFFKNKNCYVPETDEYWYIDCFKRFSDNFLKLCIKACRDQRKTQGLKPRPCRSDLTLMIEKQSQNFEDGVYRETQHQEQNHV